MTVETSLNTTVIVLDVTDSLMRSDCRPRDLEKNRKFWQKIQTERARENQTLAPSTSHTKIDIHPRRKRDPSSISSLLCIDEYDRHHFFAFLLLLVWLPVFGSDFDSLFVTERNLVKQGVIGYTVSEPSVPLVFVSSPLMDERRSEKRIIVMIMMLCSLSMVNKKGTLARMLSRSISLSQDKRTHPCIFSICRFSFSLHW